MSNGSRLAFAFLLIVIAAALLLLTTDGTSAADIEHTSDWVISDTTVQVTDKTIDVIGNVTVANGGVLKLYNCTLDILCAVAGQFSLEVTTGGRLEVYDSIIHGTDERVNVLFHDDVFIEGSQISHIRGGSTSVRGLTVDGGTTSIKDSTISDSNYHGIYVLSDLFLDNVTVSDVVYTNVYVYNWGSDADYSVTISNCEFIGDGSASAWKAGVMLYAFQSGDQVDVTVTDTTFRNCYRGVYISTTGKGNIDVQRCTFIDNRQGVAMSSTTSSGNHVFKDNTFSSPGIGGGVGMIITYRSAWGPVVENNVVSNLHTGYIINGRWGVAQTVSVGNLTVSDCTRGLVSDYDIQLTLHNSSFTRIASSLECFVARNSSTITIIDTDHPWGSATVEHANSWIKAYTDVEIRGAKWKDGASIGDGFLVLENVTQFEVARFNLSDLRSQDVAGWEVTSTDRRTSLYLYPALYVDGYGFRGERLDMRTYTSSIVELVDDLAPTLSIGSPEPDAGYAVTTIVARGSYDEKGAGLNMIQFSLDSNEWYTVTSWSDGGWNLPLTSLVEGEHDLALRATDKAGNMGDTVSVTFLVDTIAPLLEVDPYSHLVNTTSVTITGRTEVHATFTVNGNDVVLDDNGNFSVELALIEGSNAFNLAVSDRAGNSNGTQLLLVSDTIVPDLEVTSPEDDMWTNARWVNVEGTAEPGVDLLVNGEPVEMINGTFKKRVDLVESDFIITVTAVDTAGNSAMKVRVIHVDWTAPELIIVEPEEAEVYVRESTIYISGDVDDPTVDNVLVNDEVIPLTSGRFVKQFTVLEGTTEFIITVVDTAMNGVSAKVVVIRDLTPPTYESEMVALGGDLLYIDGDQYCTAPAVEVYLIISELSLISLEGGTQLPTGTEVRQKFDLEEGVNDLEIYIVDTAGNQAQTFSQRVFVDTTAPTLSIQSPQPGYRTKDDTVTIHGFTEVGATLTLNGETVNVLAGGEYRHIVALVDGRNEFTLDVEDAMGNSNTASLSVLRESDVTTGGTSSTGSTVTGFVMGLVVGIVLMLAFFYVRGRNEGPDREPSGPRHPEPREPFHGSQASDEETDGKANGGWEEY
jgi:hypothetical protein